MTEKLKALVVEDDPELRAYLARCLLTGPRVGSVIEARDGREALEALRGGAVNVVLTDILLSGMDGLSLCRRLDEATGLRDLPVLVISGDAESLAEARAYTEGKRSRALLSKPFNSLTLLRALESLLEEEKP